MTAFNFFSHGTQDLYPTFLQVQHHFSPHEVGLIAVIYNIGAIIGGMSFGALVASVSAAGASSLSPRCCRSPCCRCGRFRPARYGSRVGAFLMQVTVQGAWGVIPAHLERIVARRGARHVSGFRLSAR